MLTALQEWAYNSPVRGGTTEPHVEFGSIFQSLDPFLESDDNTYNVTGGDFITAGDIDTKLQEVDELLTNLLDDIDSPESMEYDAIVIPINNITKKSEFTRHLKTALKTIIM